MSSFAFAQTEDKAPVDSPASIKLYEFGKATNGYVKRIFTEFQVELNADPNAQGYIINYGTDIEIARRERQIKEGIIFCRIDAPRITIVKGGNIGKLKTQIWIVPAGAEMPTP
jgi:hypothetical protein